MKTESEIRTEYQKEAMGKTRKEKIEGVSKLLYLDVIIRTSGYALLIGMIAAVLFTGNQFNWINAVMGFAILILMQGLMQHSIDTVMDKDPVEHSRFRKFAIRTFTTNELNRIYYVSAIVATVVVIFGIIIIERWLIIIPFLFGMRCIYMYAKTGLISYPAFGWANVAMAGWLLQADIVISTDFEHMLASDISVIALCLFVMCVFQIGQVLYKIDDSINLMNTKQIIEYQRSNLRFIHHQSFLPLIGFILGMFGYYWYATVFVILFVAIWIMKRHSICNNSRCGKWCHRKCKN